MTKIRNPKSEIRNPERVRRACFGFRYSDFGFAARLTAFLFFFASLRAAEPTITGYTEPYKIITVSCAEHGVIAEMLVQEGDAVKAKQVLARLDTAEMTAELDIARAEAKLALTRKQKIDELAASTRVSPEEIEKSRTDLIVKDAQVRRIEAGIENRTMRSPVDGIVTEIKRDPSETVSATNPHVLTVVQIDKLTANLFLPPSRALALKQGAAVTLQLLDPPERVPATIEFISPVTDSASGTVRVKFVIENKTGAHRSGVRCTLAE